MRRRLCRSFKLSWLPKQHPMIWDAMAVMMLFYILLYWLVGYFIDNSTSALVLRTLVCLAFLPLYIGALWLQSSRLGPMINWLMVALGLIAHSDYWGALVIVVLATGFLVHHHKLTQAVSNLVIVTIVTLLAGYYFEQPTIYLVLVPPLIIIGGLGEHFFFSTMRTESKLLQAQSELAAQASQIERERIARDLHDVMGHALSAIAIKSELAGKLSQNDPKAAQLEMQEVEHTARHLLQEVRQAVVGYQASGLQHECNMAKATLQSSGIHVSGSAKPIQLSEPVDNALCLILREAVTNILRHANATRATLTGDYDGDNYCLRLLDNGVGLGAARAGNGMKNMQLRAIKIGAQVHYLDSEQGCHLELRVRAND